jgi:hypothetical protein
MMPHPLLRKLEMILVAPLGRQVEKVVREVQEIDPARVC